MQNILKYIAWIGAMVGAWFSNMPDVVRILLILMFFDVLSGAIAAGVKGDLSARTAWNGVGKKAVTLCVVALVYTASNMIVSADLSAPIGQAITGFYIYVEGVSIIENAIKIGIPVPDFVQKAISTLDPEREEAKG